MDTPLLVALPLEEEDALPEEEVAEPEGLEDVEEFEDEAWPNFITFAGQVRL